MNALEAYVKERGAISVAEFMKLALMHTDFGYYQTQRAIGATGDFITAPEISQIFGEIIGICMAYEWQQAGGPKAALVELGPGRGTLMKDMLRATKHVPEFHDHIDIHMIEKSAALRAAQQTVLAGVPVKISWHEEINGLPKLPLFIVANEFFDALPIRQFAKKNAQWFERLVMWNDAAGKLVFTLSDAPHDMKHRAIRDDAEVMEINEAGEAIFTALAEDIRRQGGAMIVVDYGYEGGSRIDTLQAMKGHAYADMLQKPGECDITAHVDFDALRRIADSKNLLTEVKTQGKFLLEMGAGERAQSLCKALDEEGKKSILDGVLRLVSPDQMGSLFKVLICSRKNPVRA